MHLSIQQTVHITIDSLIITLSSSMIFISVVILTLIIHHLMKRTNSPNQVALVLTANMYVALIFLGITCLIQYTYALQDHIYSISANNGIYCQIRAYFQLISVSTVYYTNFLQAVYRLCRIIFHTKQSLQSMKLYRKLIIIQWIICFLSFIPSLLIGDFKYSENECYCQIDYKDVRNIWVNAILIYFIPVGFTFGCYGYTLYKIPKNKNNTLRALTRIQQMIVRRELIVFTRICLLLGLLLINFIPSFVTLLNYYINGYMLWWSIETAWLVFLLTAVIVSVISALVFPHVSSLLRKNHHPHQQAIVVPLAVIRIK